MKTTNSVVLMLTALILTLALAGCDDDGGDEPGYDVRGLTNEEVVDAFTDATCDYLVRCGMPTESCELDESDTWVCTGTIEPVPEATCAEDNAEDNDELIACGYTPELATALNRCLNSLGDQRCMTQAELDAIIESGDDLTGFSDECDVVGTMITACNE